MIYFLGLLNILAALLMLAAVVGLLPRIDMPKFDISVVIVMFALHLISIAFGSIQIMSGALAGLQVEDVAVTLWISYFMRICQIIASIILIWLNIRSYMNHE